jgi:hypothetical protein
LFLQIQPPSSVCVTLNQVHRPVDIESVARVSTTRAARWGHAATHSHNQLEEVAKEGEKEDEHADARQDGHDCTRTHMHARTYATRQPHTRPPDAHVNKDHKKGTDKSKRWGVV